MGVPNHIMQLYKDMNQVSEAMRLDQMEFSEVMVIHRMYIKLEELDLGHLEGAEKVKRLYVFADMVEVGQSVVARLPGSFMVVILCRVLWLPDEGSTPFIMLPHLMKLRAVETSEPIQVPVGEDEMFLTGLGLFRAESDEEYPSLCIHAGVIQFSLRKVWSAFESQFSIFNPHPPPTSTPLENIVFSSPYRKPDTRPVLRFLTSTFLNQRSQITTGPEYFTLDPASRAYTTSSIVTDPPVHWPPASVFDVNTLHPTFSVLDANIPDVLLTDDKILLAMQTSMLIAELVEVAHPASEDTRATTIAKHVEWLSGILLQALSKVEGSPSHYEYLALSFRAQYLIKTRRTTRRHVVPQLQYDIYSPVINRMAQIAETYDDSLRQFKLYIAQNQILGSYLLEQNRAFGAKERDLEVFHSELISQRENELRNTLIRMDDLSRQMDKQTAEMDKAKEEMEAGLRRFHSRTVANAMFGVLGAIGSIALGIFTGGATARRSARRAVSAAQEATRAANTLREVMRILERLEVVLEVVSILKELMESLQDLSTLVEAPEMPDLPTELDWNIFDNEIEGVAAQMPSEVSEVSAWKTKCKNVAVVGREMITTAAYISQLQYDIKEHSMLQEIAQRHADRLSAIKVADLSSYTEMVLQMEMRTARIMVSLIKVIHMQNAALMYQCLWPPTEVTTWPSLTIETAWIMLMQQEQSALLGLMRLGPSVDFMRTYVVKDIPVSLLLNGEDWEFKISVEDYTTFPSTWSRVRIHHLEMKFAQAAHVHRPITDSGNVYILLQGLRTFDDRSEGDYLHYEAAMPLDYHYAYCLDTGETTLSNMPSNEFIKTFMRMTPFTNWRLRLSGSAEENKGLAFPTAEVHKRTSPTEDPTTEIAITFYISAIRRTSY